MGSIKDYATSLVATAPSPANSGTSLVVTTGHGSRFPDAPFFVTVHPHNEVPTLDNAEKVEVTAKTGDTFTVTRAQGDTTAKNIAAGWRITNALFESDISSKVDKVAGKGLSTEDYTSGEKSKLAGIEPLADVTDATNVAAAGAVMTTGNQTVGGSKTFNGYTTLASGAHLNNTIIEGLKAPTGDDHAATKGYVDAADATKVTAPSSATDNAVARFDGTTGKLIQNSSATINDSGDISGRHVIASWNIEAESGSVHAGMGVHTDTIYEGTSDSGVTIDGVLIKDGAIAKSVVGLGNVDNTSNATERNAVATLSNKTIIPRSNAPISVVGGDTLTVDASQYDIIAAQITPTSGGTLTIDRPVSGHPYIKGYSIMIIIRSYVATTNLSWHSNYKATGQPLPTVIRNGNIVIVKAAYFDGDWHVTDISSQESESQQVITGEAQTLTNKRINPRVSSTTSASSLTPTIASFDQYCYTALAANLTINAPTGTPVNGNKLLFRIKDNGSSRTLTWNAIFREIGIALPTSTTASKTHYIGAIYNAADTKWDVIAVAEEA